MPPSVQCVARVVGLELWQCAVCSPGGGAGAVAVCAATNILTPESAPLSGLAGVATVASSVEWWSLSVVAVTVE